MSILNNLFVCAIAAAICTAAVPIDPEDYKQPVRVSGKGNFNISEENIRKQIPRIDALAKEMKLGVIDMHAALEDKPELIPDRVHPNARGAGEMAGVAYSALTGKPAPGPASVR